VTAPAHTRRVPIVIPGAIAGAWLICVVAQLTGRARLVHHDVLIHSGLPLWIGLLAFLLAWQLMTAAMMLPSSLPMIQLFGRVSANQDRPGVVMAAFLGGYAYVWTLFGAVAFLFDLGIHRSVDSSVWLTAHQWLVPGGLLVIAGAFQFSSLKDACLDKCRVPSMYLMQHYKRGTDAAFKLGRGHGFFCLGCCWALMLVMFAAGVGNLAWMGAVGLVMVYEKVGRQGKGFSYAVGVALLIWAAFVFAHPAWLPSTLSGVR